MRAVVAALDRTGYALALGRSEIAKFQAENEFYSLKPEKVKVLERTLENFLPPLRAGSTLLWLLN